MTSEVFCFFCYCCSKSEWSLVQAAPWHTFSSVSWPDPRARARVHGWIYKRVTPRTPLIEQAASNALITRVQTPPPPPPMRAPAGEAICHAKCHGEDEKTVPSVDDVELGEEPLGSVYTPGAGDDRGGWRRLGVNGDNRGTSNQLHSTSSTYHANLFQTVFVLHREWNWYCCAHLLKCN